MPILTFKTFTKSLVTQLHTLLFFIKKYKRQIPSLYYQIIGKKKKKLLKHPNKGNAYPFLSYYLILNHLNKGEGEHFLTHLLFFPIAHSTLFFFKLLNMHKRY